VYLKQKHIYLVYNFFYRLSNGPFFSYFFVSLLLLGGVASVADLIGGYLSGLSLNTIKGSCCILGNKLYPHCSVCQVSSRNKFEHDLHKKNSYFTIKL